MAARLMVIAGPDLGRFFDLEPGQALQVGRSASAGLRLTDPGVARVHCEIEYDGTRAILFRNAGSETLVNGVPIPEEHELQGGDRVRLGSTELCFVPPEGGAGCDSVSPPGAPGSFTPPYRRLNTPSSGYIAGPIRRPILSYLDPPRGPGEIGRLAVYRLQRLIGEGGMGAVFQAEDTHLHRKVALKVMKPEFTSDNEGRLRFLAEAQAMAALPHDYVVLVYQVGLEHGLPFIAMEYLEGETLESFLKRSGRLPLIQALRVAADVATGLTVAHHRGVIHRDIKPSNLWLDSVRRRVKLLDFGLAHHARASTGLTRPGEVLGTPDYMAPEQAHGADVDSRTDLYALGVVLYRMLSGRLPYERSTAMATMYALANEPVPSLKAALPELPHEVAAYVARLMAKDPAKRPASAHEVARWLTDHRQRLKTVSTSAPSMPDIPMETTTTAGSVPRPNDMDAAFAVEYRAAEWAARKKGLVELRVRSSNRSITIDRVADLPTEPFVVMHLNLASRAISDAELVLLAGLSSVEMIDLTNTPITDRSTRFLGGLRSLRMLILAYTKITDAGLAALANLPRLRSLYLMGTEVTHEGVQAIQAALPRCQVMES